MTGLLTKLFVKNYQNTDDPRVRGAYGTMVSVTGMVLNLLLFVAKFTVGTLFGSVAISADAINNLSDAGSQIISFISFRISAKPADREHPFGHARIEYVASMIVSFLILLIGIEMIKESVTKILSPELPEKSWVAVIVLSVSILVKLWLGLFNRRIGKKLNSSVMRATAADSLSDAIATAAVLLTTLAMFLFPTLKINLDAYMGVAVAVLILVAGLRILNETKNAILGEAPSDEIVKKICEVVDESEGVLGIHDLIVHNYGPGRVVASLHVEVDGKVDIFVSHDRIDNMEKRLRRECGIEATIHMDPLNTDDELLNTLRPLVEQAVQEIDPSFCIHDFRIVTGDTHTNLIFDVAATFESKLTDDEIRRAVADKVSRINPSYFTVITVDRG